METKFVQIHTLQSYPAALLNRDDAGFAKTLSYGGTTRTRISSQCLKRHWRLNDGNFALASSEGVTQDIRSRDTVEKSVMLGVEGEAEVLQAITDEFNKGLYGKDGATQAKRQPLLLGYPEVEYLRELAKGIASKSADDAEQARSETRMLFSDKASSANLAAFRAQTQMPGGLTSAMFGHMVTSDTRANIDAAVHVAHAFTVHANESDSEYFTVVDDLPVSSTGAAHINISELNSGLYYGYVVADVAALTLNVAGCDSGDWLSADRELVGKIVGQLLGLIATVSPGAKVGATAPYSYANFMLVEIGDWQPRGFSTAYRGKVKPQIEDAVSALARYMEMLDDNYGVETERRFFSIDGSSVPNAKRANLNEIVEWVEKSIAAGSMMTAMR